ncbi:MAG: AgmX/PglI C-terminal domain-containing protein [Polyangiaceae bacterium]
MAKQGVPEWFGQGKEPEPPRRGGPPKATALIVLAAVSAMVAGAGVVALQRRGAEAEARARAADEQARADEAQRARLMSELEKLAQTPTPKEPDPSELPDIEDVLDDDGSTEADAAAEDAAPAADEGTRTPESVQQVTRGLNPALRRCFDDELARNPNAEGALQVELKIAADGAVTSVVAQPTGKLGPSVRSCVVQVYEKAKFPPAEGPTTVRIPVRFTGAR